MLRDAVRGVVAVATTVAEEAGRRVVGTAAVLLERSGVDVAAVERRVAEQFPPSARSFQTLAGEAVTVGRAGIDLAVGVARSEVERVFETVGDQVVKLGVVLGYLEGKLRDVDADPVDAAADGRGPTGRREPRAEGLFTVGWEDEDDAAEPAAPFAKAPTPAETAPDDGAGEPAAKAPEAPEAPEAKRTTAKATGTGKAATESTAEKGAPAKKDAGKKAAAKRTPAKAAVKKTTAKKTTTRKATAKRTAAQPPAAKKAAARRTTTVVKKSVTRRPAQEPEDGGA